MYLVVGIVVSGIIALYVQAKTVDARMKKDNAR